jgi:hypothetical protein
MQSLTILMVCKMKQQCLLTDFLSSDLHWNEEEKMYCDVGVNDDGGTYIIIESIGN